jgi:hypothetical protein
MTYKKITISVAASDPDIFVLKCVLITFFWGSDQIKKGHVISTEEIKYE